MKNNKRKVWKTGVIAGMLTALVLAFSACGSEPEDSSTAEVKTTTTTTVTTKATTTVETTTTTAKTTTETSEITTTAETTAAEAKKEPEKGTAVAEPVVNKPKATTAKPAQPTPVKTTAAPKGHYETIHHEAVTQQVWVEDSPAGEKTIFQCRCGAKFNSYNEYVAHDDAALEKGDDTHYRYEFWYEEVPAQGHYETQVIQAAYDEQVWVQD